MPEPSGWTAAPDRRDADVTLPWYELGAKVATRKAYGEALAALGARRDVVAMDGEVSNSTFAEDFAKAHPGQFFEMFIAEQQLVAAAVGFSVRGYVPFASTFAAFLSRAHDFLRMAAISKGVVYMRTTRGAYPVPYEASEEFPVGGSKAVRASDQDHVTLVGAGVGLHECLAAADTLATEGLNARVIDLYSLKPLDTPTLLAAAEQTSGLVLVEDHHPEGGLASAVLEALAEAGRLEVAVTSLAVRELPGSGTSEELLDQAGISARHIAGAARSLVGASSRT